MSTPTNYNVIQAERGFVKAWTQGVPVEGKAQQQLKNIANMPFIYKWVAAMPDVHLGKGATVGSVVPTDGAIIPAAVGVDIGCGMMAVQTSLRANDLPDNLRAVRSAIETAVPHGRTANGGRGDRGAWGDLPNEVGQVWSQGLKEGFDNLVEESPTLSKSNNVRHLGTLGTGNHFIEVCLDETDQVWVMLHSGSRGIGNRIGSHFIKQAKRDMERWFIHLPDSDLAYLPEGSKHFGDYVRAVGWAQEFAMQNRALMMRATLLAMESTLGAFSMGQTAVNCHHNYVAKEVHYGRSVWVTRKGAVRAGLGDLGIIPGSMGTRSFIVRGKGNRESFCSCSHGAGRVMSRTAARKAFTVADHEKATVGIECRKDESVLDETPAAYKNIDDVMAAQADLVDIVHTLRQVVCVKG